MDAFEGLTPVVKLIRELAERRTLVIAADPNGVAQELGEYLIDMGIPRENLVQVRQGYSLRQAYITLERRLRSGHLRHAAQPLMGWATANARVDGTTQLISKRSSGNGKIDPLVALACAAVAAMEQPPAINVDAMIAPPDANFRPQDYGNDLWRPGWRQR